MGKRWIILGAALAAGCSQQAASPPATTTTTAAPTHATTITITAHKRGDDGVDIARQNDRVGAQCGPIPIMKPVEPWRSMVEGADVVVTDGAGAIVAKTTLPAGALPEAAGTNSFTCNWKVDVTVPETAFYTVSVGGQKVGTLTQAEMSAHDWAPIVPMS